MTTTDRNEDGNGAGGKARCQRSRISKVKGSRDITSNAPNSAQRIERYLALAREATVNGDTIEIDNCYQHAEHYFRVMGAGRLTRLGGLEDYLRLRRMAGFGMESAECFLRSFARFAAKRRERLIRAQTVVDWAALAVIRSAT
jgi:Domain of unknown function (DUF4167)